MPPSVKFFLIMIQSPSAATRCYREVKSIDIKKTDIKFWIPADSLLPEGCDTPIHADAFIYRWPSTSPLASGPTKTNNVTMFWFPPLRIDTFNRRAIFHGNPW